MYNNPSESINFACLWYISVGICFGFLVVGGLCLFLPAFQLESDFSGAVNPPEVLLFLVAHLSLSEVKVHNVYIYFILTVSHR